MSNSNASTNKTHQPIATPATPSWEEVRWKAWELAKADDPSIPLGQKDLFFNPGWGLTPGPIADYYHNVVIGKWVKLAEEILSGTPPVPEPPQAKRVVKPEPAPAPAPKRHDRRMPVRVPTDREVRDLARAMAIADDPFLTNRQRELFYYPEWASPPMGSDALYIRKYVKAVWLPKARAALEAQCAAEPRPKIPKRKKQRHNPYRNPYRAWTRKPLPNGAPQPRRRIFRLPELCVDPAAPPPEVPSWPIPPPDRPREDITPARPRPPTRRQGSVPLPGGDGRAD